MSVTQNYKTFNLSASDDAIRYIVAAVMRQLVTDRERVESAKDSALVDFMRRETATGNEALTALNCTSGRAVALKGEMLQAAMAALRFAMHARNLAGAVPLDHALDGMSIRGISFVDMNAALQFLENPK